MEIYLAVITTALVLTQIIRLAQNAISLHRQNQQIKKQLAGIDDITQADLDRQREAYRLIVEWLKSKEKKNERD